MANEDEIPFLNDTVDGVVDHEGHPAPRSKSGGWTSAGFIIGVEVAERFAYYGIEANLISYLTGSLGQSTAAAAANVNAWGGAASLLPLLGAFVADSFLGRYRTIILANLLYILGLALLTLSAMLPSISECQINQDVPCSSQIQVILFFVSLYIVAVAQGGHKPCVQAFGADQFDGQDSEECKARSSFFNWWYFGICLGSSVTVSILSYVQDNISWALGFGIPCIAMFLGLVVFLLGTRTYRYSVMWDEKNAFVRIGRVFIAAFRNRQTSSSTIATKEESRGILPHESYEQFKFLNKALLASDGLNEDGIVCSMDEVEEAKAVLRLVPIWVTCLVYGIVFAQCPTFFTKQGATMERTIVPGFDIPPASLQSTVSLAVLVFIPIYDRVVVPVARAFTGKPSGITMLQRIGTGMFLSVLSMIIAALVEIKRLQTAREYDLVDTPGMTVPMSVWWLLPQYILSGISDVFTMVGLQEFFYDQVPTELRSIGLSLYLSIFGVGSFLSSFLISIIEEATGGDGRHSWFSNNLNKAHLDYYYWLLTGLSSVALFLYWYFARSYIYRKKG
ncbi:putative peptide/nitrate transporter [Morus notabilis]|uniref:Putative peptide/nitrate transporter n=1 Tax=Morus notabilis TaxID=981085 RepID=W9RAX7_9ROSA|nr:protein NRT1/ PTR FAMILY 5.10 [Morus notabilis]EXB62498.1 putative peptide/nitrate transporter [Morus notabilis]